MAADSQSFLAQPAALHLLLWWLLVQVPLGIVVGTLLRGRRLSVAARGSD